jgi:histidinol phosphatase-like PHP family hydrolase
MYDFHTHTLLSDGELLPSELLRRMHVLGYSAVAITDHGDRTNITHILHNLEYLRPTAEEIGIRFLSGIELTHIPPSEIGYLASLAKREGAEIVVVHGETPVEPVAGGTNHAACISPDVDILAHPGLITEEDAILAEENDIALEITARGGHNRTNGHVVRIAQKTGCMIVINSDSHKPDDLMSAQDRYIVGLGAGIGSEVVETILTLKANRFYRRFM